jgi:hypothetical protein
MSEKKDAENNLSAGSILGKTKSILFARALAYLAIMAAMLIVGFIGLFICYQLLKRELLFMTIIVFVLIFGGFFALLRFARRYFLYMIKAAHVAAITEIIKTGDAPVTEGGIKGVIAYGTETVKNNFGEANIAFVADALIQGATRQIMRWLNKVERLFSFIPGAEKAMQFINLVLSTALNYIDEAVLSYVFLKKSEKNGFKKACDGLGYYAQSWKDMLKGAFKVAAFIWILRIIVFIVFYGIFISVGRFVVPSGATVDFFAILLSLILLYGIEAIIVEPYATCIMIRAYHLAIKGKELKADIHGTLCKVSAKFRSLFEKSGQKAPAISAKQKMPTSL